VFIILEIDLNKRERLGRDEIEKEVDGKYQVYWRR
jgi:hypothetical protein